MANVTIDDLKNLIYDYIAAQAKRDAERDKIYAEQKAEYEKKQKEQAQHQEEYEKKQKEQAQHQEEHKKWLEEHEKEHKKWLEEHEKKIAKYRTEYEKEHAEYKKDQKQLQKNLGKLGNSYGEQVEAMFVNLGTKFNKLGFTFPKEAESTKFFGENGQILVEVDRLLENGSVIMPVEVKAKLKQDDVDDHIRRLGIISNYNVLHNDNRKVLGAVAGGVVSQKVVEYAHKKGLYVLVQNGDSIKIADIPSNFKPYEW